MISSPDVALFLPTMRGGGAEKAFLNIAKGLVAGGYKVDFVLARAEGVYLPEAELIAKVFDLKSRRMAGTFPGLIRYIRRSKPVVILSALGLANFFAILATKLADRNARVIVSLHNMASFQNLGSIKSLVENQITYWSYQWADQIVAVSHTVAKDTSKKGGIPIDRIKVIYNPILSPNLSEQAAKEVNHPFFSPGHPPVILGVGRLEREKDFATLLRAFALVQKEVQARLLILGEGEERCRLETLARELEIDADVSMPGFVENPYAYMSKAGVFVLSSLTEGFGNVLIEAMACGCPVVSTACEGGPREILDNGKYGFLTPVRDAESMAKVILSVLAGEQKTAPREWLTQFAQETVIDQYVSVLGLPVRSVFTAEQQPRKG